MINFYELEINKLYNKKVYEIYLKGHEILYMEGVGKPIHWFINGGCRVSGGENGSVFGNEGDIIKL